MLQIKAGVGFFGFFVFFVALCIGVFQKIMYSSGAFLFLIKLFCLNLKC